MPSRTIPPTGSAGPHGTMLGLETLPSPRVGETEGFEFLFVFFFGDGAVFGSGHRFSWFVDVAGPAFVAVGVRLGGGVLGDLGGAVGFGFGFEERSGFFADCHGVGG